MSGRLSTIIVLVAALLHSAGAHPADPTITAPAVLPRQDSDNFIGYVRLNNTWSSLECDPGATWYQSGQYAQCCPATLDHCYAPTACVGGTQIYTYPDISSVKSVACTDNYEDAALSICNTVFIFENISDSHPRTNVNCGISSQNWSYYRDVPSTTTATSSHVFSVVRSDLISLSSISTVTTTAPVPPAETYERVSSSKVWVAGAVVGPVLGFALIAAVIWLLLRRKQKAAQLLQRGSTTMAPIDPNALPTGVEGYIDAKPQFHPTQPTHYGPDPYVQQGYFQQGVSSPALQYGYQSTYNAAVDLQTGMYTHDAKYVDKGDTAELGGDENQIAKATRRASAVPSGAVSVFELSGVDAKRPRQGVSDSNKPQ